MYVCKLRARLARKLPLGALKYVNPIFIYYMCVGNICTIRSRGRTRSKNAYKQGKTRKMRHTGAEYIYNVDASYSSFVFVMPIVALRRLSLSPVWHTFSEYLWFSLYCVHETTGWSILYLYIYISIYVFNTKHIWRTRRK